MSTHTAVADAVVADLNSQDWTIPCQAARVARVDLESLGLAEIPTVLVMARDEVGRKASRASWEEDYGVDVIVAQRPVSATGESDPTLERLDALASLCQAMRDRLRSAALTLADGRRVAPVSYSRQTDAGPWSEAALAEWHGFLSVYRFTFRLPG